MPDTRKRDNSDSNVRENALLIETDCGMLKGRITTVNASALGGRTAEVRQFLGIPYAEPPVGALRWCPPRPPSPWNGVRDATRFAMPAPQNPNFLFEIRGPNSEEPDNEDCLYLNIHAPLYPEYPRLPVMVWIHGGSFYLGSGCQPLYDGQYLAGSGRAIVVTINYRLGALGFLRLKDISDIPATGNEGILDQIAALRWVQKNIAAFGGDPDNITLFGESAGAMSIASLFAAQDGNSESLGGRLFHKAIVQSGNPGVYSHPENATAMADKFCEILSALRGNVPLSHPPTTRELLKAQEILLNDPETNHQWGHLPFKPVLDNELITRPPIEAIRNGAGSSIAIMVGSNRDEWNLFSAARPETLTLDDQQIRNHLRRLLPDKWIQPLLDHYRRQAESQAENPWPLWSRVWNLMLTDMTFTVPGLRLLQAHSGKRFHYHFSQPLSAQPMLGACHASELGYVFGTHGDPSLQHLYGGEQEPHFLSESMRNAWLNFAESGDPGGGWPGFDQGHSRCFGNRDSDPMDTQVLQRVWEILDDRNLRGFL
ncbi:carboxylesterase/lipase family protein [Microbulbifer pacificus]|uniref:Carboxylic ester hydrolase n=1 Tax=Microbulbifer pacificus TaxID=407164 RepID=A0AAU0MYB1_9GAMM|nr:carboxylesterase family protein [Microbulbifer pacificus]WOX05191.1 carboxylesterase family protein [Microbulbifer pacificus]